MKDINATNRWQFMRMCGGALGGALLGSQCGVLCRLMRRIDSPASKPGNSVEVVAETRHGRLAGRTQG
jgi:hypothetical protein